MSHINYNHLYYFWHVYKQGSVVGAAEALYLTPQTITGQIKALEERLQGKLFKRKGRGIEPSELGELVFERSCDAEGVDQWVEDFLRLEASGWKGSTGHAPRNSSRSPISANSSATPAISMANCRRPSERPGLSSRSKYGRSRSTMAAL